MAGDSFMMITKWNSVPFQWSMAFLNECFLNQAGCHDQALFCMTVQCRQFQSVLLADSLAKEEEEGAHALQQRSQRERERDRPLPICSYARTPAGPYKSRRPTQHSRERTSDQILINYYTQSTLPGAQNGVNTHRAGVDLVAADRFRVEIEGMTTHHFFVHSTMSSW